MGSARSVAEPRGTLGYRGVTEVCERCRFKPGVTFAAGAGTGALLRSDLCAMGARAGASSSSIPPYASTIPPYASSSS